MKRSENGKHHTLPWYGIPAIAGFLKPYRKRMVLMAFLGIVSSLIDSLYPVFNKYVINHNIALKTLDTLPFVVIGYLLVLAFQVWDNYYTCCLCSRLELHVNRDLRNASFNHLQTLSFSYFNQNNVGYIHARVMSDSGKIGELVSWRLMDFVWHFSYILCVIIVMFLTNPKLGLMIFLLFPVDSQ